MGRTWLLRHKRDPADAPQLFAGSVLIALAVGGRSAAILVPAFEWNWLAAAAWSLAFFMALVTCLAKVEK